MAQRRGAKKEAKGMGISKESASIFPVTRILPGTVPTTVTWDDANVSTKIVARTYKSVLNVYAGNDG